MMSKKSDYEHEDVSKRSDYEREDVKTNDE